MKTDITRRSFLKQSSLVIAVTTLSSPLRLFNASSVKAASELPFKPHAFLEIATDDTVTVWVGQTELGQGTHTGIAMILLLGRDRQVPLPFGPYLAIAGWITFLWGDDLIQAVPFLNIWMQ